jgi:hypothetical protein
MCQALHAESLRLCPCRKDLPGPTRFVAKAISKVEAPETGIEMMQHRLLAELDAEAAQMEAVRSLIPRFEVKIQRVLDRVWGSGREA